MILTLNPFARTPEPVDPIGPETELSNRAELYLVATDRLKAAKPPCQIARSVPALLNTSIILEGLVVSMRPMPAREMILLPGDKRAAGHYGVLFCVKAI